MNFKAESSRLADFLIQQGPRIQTSVREDHHLSKERVLAWMIAIDLGISIVLMFATLVTAFRYFSLQDNLLAIVQGVVVSLAYFVTLAVLLGLWIEKCRATPMNWNSWMETLFISLLPYKFLAPLCLWIFPYTLYPIAILGLAGYSAYLIYRGIQTKFPLPSAENNKHLKIGLSIAVVTVFLLSVETRLWMS